MTDVDAEDGTARRASRRPKSTVVSLLSLYAVTLIVIPSNTTLPAVGAAGFPASLVGLTCLALYVTWTLLGAHDPTALRYPTRFGLLAMWVITFCSYVAAQFRDKSVIESNGADRWILFFAGMSGVILLAAEGLKSMSEILWVFRVLTWAGAACGAVAAAQFWLHVDLATYIGQAVPGFQFNGSLGGIQSRGALNRVPGTTLHPIELGAVASMLVPVALALAMLDRHRHGSTRYIPLALIAVCVPVSVSRSAIIAIAVAGCVFMLQLPARQRAAAISALPFAGVAIFMLVPGLMRTLSGFFRNAGTDTSVSTRTDDYPLVEALVREHPWFGAGGGTYLPDDLRLVLDNAYLKWVIEFGIVGLGVMVLFYVAVPVMAAVTVRRRSCSQQTRLLGAAFAAGLSGSAISAGTFDSWAFPAFVGTQALIIGMTGALWRQLAVEEASPPEATPSGQCLPHPLAGGAPWTR